MKIVAVILALVIVDLILDTIFLGSARVKSILSFRFGHLFRRKKEYEEPVYEADTEDCHEEDWED